MSNLKTALVIVKNTSEADFNEVYDLIKNTYLNKKAYLPTYNIDNLVNELDKLRITMEIKQIQGLSVSHQGREKKVFPHAAYGWDGGSPIHTEEFNLEELDTNDFGGGPIASIVTFKNPNYPGFALHYSPDEQLGEIHIFM